MAAVGLRAASGALRCRVGGTRSVAPLLGPAVPETGRQACSAVCARGVATLANSTCRPRLQLAPRPQAAEGRIGTAHRMGRGVVGRQAGVWRPAAAVGGQTRACSTTTIDIQARAESLFEDVLVPLNERVFGPLDKSVTQITPMPMVFVLGNHSSGKSSFLNYVIGRPVQTEGLAPTDDGFTIIAPGHEDADQDGPSLIGDEGLGYSGLRGFGTNLINHVALKVRKDMGVDNMMLVDSPGMIDSPIRDTAEDAAAASARDRGYDFPRVIRWFSERADVILLFFDPDKPGTTGETLACMTTSLSGLEHKVHIILNKVDQFAKTHDFARAYGSLCWNLSKVIPRKDLPKIYTMCIPGHSNPKSLQEALPDLELARNQIVEAVQMAPLRRVDNSITRLYNSARKLHLHASMLDGIRRQYRSAKLQYTLLTAAGLLGGAGLGAGALMGGLIEVAVPVFGLSVLGTAGAFFLGRKKLDELEAKLTSNEGLDGMFRAQHVVQLAQGDEFITSLWAQVMPQLQVALRTMGLDAITKVSSSELGALDDVINAEVPALRRAATKAGSIQFNRSFSERIVDENSGFKL